MKVRRTIPAREQVVRTGRLDLFLHLALILTPLFVVIEFAPA
jgi:hypothetical protein